MPLYPFRLSFEAYTAIFPDSLANTPQDHEDFSAACVRYSITTTERMAAFCAQVYHESLGRTRFEESFDYTPERLREVFPKLFQTAKVAAEYVEKGPKAIASRVYANRMGNGSEASTDGWRYRGGGDMQLTGARNYQFFGQKLGLPLWSHPELVRTPKVGALVAAAFWDDARCNNLIDAGDFDGVCDKINIGHKTTKVGDSNGFADRLKQWQRIRPILGLAPIQKEDAA